MLIFLTSIALDMSLVGHETNNLSPDKYNTNALA